MKNILKILFLIGLSGNFLIAAKMYKLDEASSPETFTKSDFSELDDAYFVVGVTTAPTTINETTEWEIPDAKLNPVFKLNADFLSKNSITEAGPGYYYLSEVTTVSGTESKTYKSVVLNTLQHEQYTGQPLFMLYDAWAEENTDYKGDPIPTGKAVLQFFPVLDMAQFTTAGGGYFDYYYKVDGETTWNKCNTFTKGPNEVVSTETEVFGDLNDHLPVETIWDAKTDLPTDFNKNIVVRIRAKYGTAPFPSAPTDSGSGSPSPGSGGTYVWKTGGNNIGVLDSEASEDFNSDGTKDGLDKIMQVVQASGLVNVGTFNDGSLDYSVYDFTVEALGTFLNGTGKPAGTYAAFGTQLVEVELSGAGGSE